MGDAMNDDMKRAFEAIGSHVALLESEGNYPSTARALRGYLSSIRVQMEALSAQQVTAEEIARLAKVEQQAHGDRYAILGALGWSGEWPLGVEKLKPSRHVKAMLERLEKAESGVSAQQSPPTPAQQVAAEEVSRGAWDLGIEKGRRAKQSTMTPEEAAAAFACCGGNDAPEGKREHTWDCNRRESEGLRLGQENAALHERVAALEAEKVDLADCKLAGDAVAQEALAAQRTAESRVRELETQLADARLESVRADSWRDDARQQRERAEQAESNLTIARNAALEEVASAWDARRRNGEPELTAGDVRLMKSHAAPTTGADTKTREALGCIENALLAVSNGLVSSQLKAAYAKDARQALRSLFPRVEPISPALAGRTEPAPSPTPPPAPGAAKEGMFPVYELWKRNPDGSETYRLECGSCGSVISPTPPPGLLEGTDDRGQAEAGPGRAQGEDAAHREGSDVSSVQAQVGGDAPPARPVDGGASVPVVHVGGSSGDVTPPGLLEALAPLVPIMEEALRRYPAGMLALYSPASEVRRILAAYDAAKGGEHPDSVAARANFNDLRRALEMATLGSHVGDTETAMGEKTVQAVRKLHEDAAKYRAAVEGIQRARNLLLYPTARWDETVPEVLRVLAPLVSDAPAPTTATLDKARVVDVLRVALPADAREAAAPSTHEVQGRVDAVREVATRLGLTLDTPPSGEPTKCSGCPHLPHLGDCPRRNGQSANPCPCLKVTPPSGPGGGEYSQDAVDADFAAWQAEQPTLARIAPTPTPEKEPCSLCKGDPDAECPECGIFMEWSAPVIQTPSKEDQAWVSKFGRQDERVPSIPISPEAKSKAQAVLTSLRQRTSPTPTQEVPPQPSTQDVVWQWDGLGGWMVAPDGGLHSKHYRHGGVFDSWIQQTADYQPAIGQVAIHLARALAEAKRETAHAQGLLDVRHAAKIGAEEMREQAAKECDETANDAEVPAHTREVARLLAKCIRALPLED